MRIIHLLFCLALPFCVVGQEGVKVQLLFDESVKHSIITIQVSDYTHKMDFKQNSEIIFPYNTVNKEGSISVHDTLEKNIRVQLPVFIDPALSQVRLKEFPEKYDKIEGLVEYSPSRTNMLNMQTRLNLSKAFENHGIKGEGYVYLSGEGYNSKGLMRVQLFE